jgi:2-polyprenyl-3-methyl-5-hydroxy-6-metoxy-1,4-benzoquinol methylase
VSYLETIYQKMGTELDPDDQYFVVDCRFMVLEEVLRAVPSGKMLDLGCGRGLLLKRLSNHHETWGCEFDPGARAACESQSLRVKSVDLNTAEIAPYGKGLFDVVVISEVCEHLLDPRNALHLAKESLRSGGTLIVTVPNAVPLFARFKLLLGKTVPWLHYPSGDTEKTGHIRFYTIESMGRLIKESGFSIQNARGVSFRMNGLFWGRLCYWLPKIIGKKDAGAPTRVDAWLSKVFPSFSPGLMLVAKKEA